MSDLKFFVYGTLKPGYDNYERYCRDRLVNSQPAQVKGVLYDLAAGYPGMTHGDQWVQGYLLTLTDAGQILSDLDALEDYHPQRAQNLYQRERTTVYGLDGTVLDQAWTYVMAATTVQAMQGIPMASGCWQPIL